MGLVTIGAGGNPALTAPTGGIAWVSEADGTPMLAGTALGALSARASSSVRGSPAEGMLTPPPLACAGATAGCAPFMPKAGWAAAAGIVDGMAAGSSDAPAGAAGEVDDETNEPLSGHADALPPPCGTNVIGSYGSAAGAETGVVSPSGLT